MKYAIISDVHANLEAVETCFREIERLKADRVICLGDLVDYCAQPNEVISIIKNNCDVVLLGNHDEAQYNYPLSERFNERARASSIHTRTVLQSQNLEYIKSLKLTHSENSLYFVHASPMDPQVYDYVRDVETASANFNAFNEKICFIGHSHRPVIFENSDSEIKIVTEGKLNINNRYIINVGSVGQPRDNNNKLSFGFFDTDDFNYTNIRVDYDRVSASIKIYKEGLPVFLAQRILEGK
ncbi:MAG TPA: metallophosphoesterase family protein [Ignavibacteria bacterium]|nr:metallophosphoesterase family protein [Ignavibacteria bacterium]HMQ97403.1 metallophosphoesterase family protein [Ignavibacteria bacterium]